MDSETPHPVEPSSDLRILAVDDDPAFREILKRLLSAYSEAEYEAFFVVDGRRALQFCAARMPDVILLDYQLPDMDGVEFLRALAEQKDGERAAVVMMTSQGDERIASQAMKFGASAYVPKRDLVDSEQLWRLIEKEVRDLRTKLMWQEQNRRLKRYESLLDAVDDAIFIINADSAEPYEMNRLAREAISGKGNDGTVLGIPPFPADRTAWWEYIEALRGQVTNRRKCEFVIDGQIVPCEISERLMWHQDNHFVVALVRNISAFEDLEQQLRDQAVNDSLTGLSNRRSFNDKLAGEWARMRRDKNESGLSLIMVDVDHFKLYNDSLGHVPGDYCLKRIAILLRDALERDTDEVFRIGGEEFAVLLHATDAAAAEAIGNRLLQAVRNAALPHPVSPTARHVTVSVGIACITGSTSELSAEPETLVQRADQALYMAKAAGRDQMVMDEDGTATED